MSGTEATGKDQKVEQKDDSEGKDEESDAKDPTVDEKKDLLSSSLIDKLGKLFAGALQIEKKEAVSVLSEISVDGIVEYMESGKCKNIVVMVGAGMSTSAGIPDFRSPGSGLYDNLQQYDLPCPEAMFEINYFREQPEPFFHLARKLIPLEVKPTLSHFFLKLLNDKGLLKRVYTQNIDGLERIAGIPSEQIVEAHGTFHSSHCLNLSCRTEYSFEWMKQKIFESEKIPECEKCSTVVKPDIVFFGERLPERFFRLSESDFPVCDLLIVIGTSLVVQPFASLIELVPENTPRLVLNLTRFKTSSRYEMMLGLGKNVFDPNSESNTRDVFIQGHCDDKCRELAEKLGWAEELQLLMK